MFDMKITFNGNMVENAPNNLFSLLALNSLEAKTGIAVAVNNSIVTKTNWKSKELKENDTVVVITATAGG